MRVFVEAETLEVYPEGIPVYILNLLLELKRNHGSEIDLYSILGCWYRKKTPGLQKALELLGPGVIKSSSNWFPRSSLKYLPQSLKKYIFFPPLPDVDIYHATANVISPNMQIKYKQLVLTVHDIVFVKHAGKGFSDPKWEDYMRNRLEMTLQVTDYIVTDTEFSRRELISAYDYSPDKISTVHIAPQWSCDPMAVPEQECRDFLTKQGLQDTRYFLTVGTVSPRKNYIRLIENFRRFNREHPESRLVVVGKNGWMSDEIVKVLEDNKDVVKWIYGISEKQLAALYRHARALFMISMYEGFGLPLVEAMACKCPICYATGSSMDEVAGYAGLKVPHNDDAAIMDAMRQYWTDDELIAEQQQTGLKRVNDFSFAKMADETFEVYKKVLNDIA